MDLSRHVDALLYLYGAMEAGEVEQAAYDIVSGTFADDRQLADRFVRLNFEYTFTRDRRMVLIHPGLSGPDSIQPRKDLLGLELPP